MLASDYEVPGPGSYDVNLSSFSFINKHKNDDKKLTRRGSDSHISMIIIVTKDYGTNAQSKSLLFG